jgi:Protein of unknown function (DUF3667)
VTPDERRLADRRTLAMRGPGAGGATPQQSLAASNPCLNCGTNVQLEFCPECGQRLIDPDPTLREFLHELAEEFLHWDGKLFTTFRMLVTKPGALTCEYLAGKRVRYISPLRVYLVCSLLFFFVSAMVPQAPLMITRGAASSTQIGPIGIQESDSTATIASLNTLARQDGWVNRLWGTHYGNALRHRSELATEVAAAIPKAMFVMVPLFAALVMLAFRRSRRRFPQHLAFALHVHAFLFLVLTLMLVRRLTGVIPVLAAVQLVCIAAVVVYLVLATRTVYEVSTGSAIARSALVATTYFVVFCFAMVATFGLIVLVQF